MSKLFELKEWFTLSETAKYLASKLGEDVTQADVLQLALEGHLILSVNLITSEKGQRGKLIPIEDAEFEDVEMWEGQPPVRIYGGVRVETDGIESHILEFEEEVVRLQGIYDLPMIGGERIEVKNQYFELVGEQRVSLTNIDGVFLSAGGEVIVRVLEDFDDNEYQEGSYAQGEQIKSILSSGKFSEADIAVATYQHDVNRAKFLAERKSNDPRRYYPAGRLERGSVFVVRNENITKFLEQISESDNSESTTANAAITATMQAQEGANMQDVIAQSVMTAKDAFVSTAEAAEWLTSFPKKSSDSAVALSAYIGGVRLIGAKLDELHGVGKRPDGEHCRGFTVPGSGGQVSIYLVRDIARSEGNALLVKFLNELIAQREAVLGVSNKAEAKSNYISRSVVHLNNLKSALKKLDYDPDNLPVRGRGESSPEKDAARNQCVGPDMTESNFEAAWKDLQKANKERNTAAKGAPASANSAPGILIP
ncbi:hypothetical protein [Rhodoferax sp. GW822-FHT02A01]|uniref:hypothetical protein n=1 Tax=Rhodoferax sp. GW822-FHT02A01 TaxID=3141537 RepID=UPI00315CE132